MKTIGDLRQFYETALLPELQGLEGRRKNVARKLILSFGLLLLGFFGVLLYAMAGGSALLAWLLIIVMLASLVYFGILPMEKFRKEFKAVVIQRIISFVDPGLSYSAAGCVQEQVFVASGMFREKPTSFKGDDFVQGRLGATPLAFSEVDAIAGSGKSARRLFKGIFFVADFNKNFSGTTVVLPDTAEKTFGAAIGTVLQSVGKPRGQLVKLEDPEFERMFVVYGDDQVEARYILSPSLMARIVDFRKRTGKEIRLSFMGSKVFVAIPYGENLFEPPIFRTLLDFGLVQKYLEDLQLALAIVGDLDLNERIWGKQ